METRDKALSRLFEMQDTGYREFVSKLIPDIDCEAVIGVRTPGLRKLAKELMNEPGIDDFLHSLPHAYYEENNLHGFIISLMKDYDRVITELDDFLPFVDNWATCDLMSPRIFKKHLPELLTKIKEWLGSGNTYTVRFGIEMLMTFYLDEHFEPEYLKLVSDVKSDEYYIKMMIAWFFATALAKQYDTAVTYIEQQRLQKWTHNKTISKAIESYRISDEKKQYLRSLKNK